MASHQVIGKALIWEHQDVEAGTLAVSGVLDEQAGANHGFDHRSCLFRIQSGHGLHFLHGLVGIHPFPSIPRKYASETSATPPRFALHDVPASPSWQLVRSLDFRSNSLHEVLKNVSHALLAGGDVLQFALLGAPAQVLHAFTHEAQEERSGEI